jgi:hypothetical protein
LICRAVELDRERIEEGVEGREDEPDGQDGIFQPAKGACDGVNGRGRRSRHKRGEGLAVGCFDVFFEYGRRHGGGGG